MLYVKRVNKVKYVINYENKIKELTPVGYEVYPDIELYMDQVTSFIDGQLAGSKRNEDDKLLTKTMINNYTKNDLLPPPVKKKYSKEHLLSLIFIYYLKNIVSINDIHTILEPITEKYFDASRSSSSMLLFIYPFSFHILSPHNHYERKKKLYTYNFNILIVMM